MWRLILDVFEIFLVYSYEADVYLVYSYEADVYMFVLRKVSAFFLAL